MKFVLARHTTADWKAEKPTRLSGQADRPLHEKGRLEAKVLASIVQQTCTDVRRIVSSDLSRSMETADIINALLHVPQTTDPRLRECSFGDLEGLTRTQISEHYGEEMLRHLDDNYRAYDFRGVNGEHREAVLERMLAVFRDLASSPVDGSTLLVGHSRAMDTVLDSLGQKPGFGHDEVRFIEFPPQENLVENR